MISSTKHTTVMLEPALDYLNVKKDNWYIDATAGGGGHTLGILEKGGCVLSIDRDQEALDRIADKLSSLKISNNRFLLKHGQFSHLSEIAMSSNLDQISGVLFDLGISSDQLDDSKRGFSFLHQGPLDMRMDVSDQLTAQEIVNYYSESDLFQMFSMWGEEPHAKKIAKAIVEHREFQSFDTTTQLADFIKKITRGPRPGIHPATRVFQALRMTVNREPEQLAHGLFHGWETLSPNGTLVVISFHSGEDRLVKRFLFDHKESGEILTPKSVTPDTEEIANNPRSRSARLRAIKKL